MPRRAAWPRPPRRHGPAAASMPKACSPRATAATPRWPPSSAKRAIVQHGAPLQAQAFSVVDLRTREVVLGGTTAPVAPVEGWLGRHFAHADLSALTRPGRYAVMLDGTWPPVQSQSFEIG